MINKDNRFDIDLSYGTKMELKVADLLFDSKVEVKTERNLWRKTGNIAIEYYSRGKKSGISVTESQWWCVVLADDYDIAQIIFVRVDKLKDYIKSNWNTIKKVNGGDDNTSKLVLVNIDELRHML